MTTTTETLIIGLGAMGSATAAHLARRGVRVIGLEAFEPIHARGSSHGESRIIREAYLESPDYVPIVQRAYQLWRELEQESGQSLLTITGGLNVGPPDGEFVAGSSRSAERFGLPVELLSPADVAARFPGFRLSDDLAAVYEPTAGILRPEECVRAHLDLARRFGADLRFTEPVVEWGVNQGRVRVRTARDSYEADRLVITAGPWAGKVLAGLGLPLEVWRIVNVHFEPTRPDLFRPDKCPIYLLQVPEGEYYGFPSLPGQGLKFGGPHNVGQSTDPDTIDRRVYEPEVELLRRVLDRYMPGASGEVRTTLTCMYTNTPDRHFVIDRHPEHPEVVYAAGFSGHGFKFATAIGEIMADLAMNGETRHDIRFLSQSRFGTLSANA